MTANFIAFLENIGIRTEPTDMTFSVSRNSGDFEWAGTSLSGVFAQKRNLFSLRMWQMIFDIVRFNQFALDLLVREEESDIDPTGAGGSPSAPVIERQQSVGEYLDENHYSNAFRNDYLIPMTACVWSTRPDKVSLEFPVITLIRFLWNHHLLNTITARPTWMTIPGGSKQYVDAIVKEVPAEQIHFNASVKSLETQSDGRVSLQFSDGGADIFDHVILATHGDQAKDIIQKSGTAEELEIMSAFETSKNVAVLHSDQSLMPVRPVAWSSWNYITSSPNCNSPPSTVCLTYSMNILQHIPSSIYGPVLVTLNPLHNPSPASTQGSWTYHHPVYNAAAIRSQTLLPRIQNTRGISYAGAWTKYGFHEDGFSSGLKVAIEHLGAKVPFKFVDSTFSRGRQPRLGLSDRLLRVILNFIQFWLVVLKLAWEWAGIEVSNMTNVISKKTK